MRADKISFLVKIFQKVPGFLSYLLKNCTCSAKSLVKIDVEKIEHFFHFLKFATRQENPRSAPAA